MRGFLREVKEGTRHVPPPQTVWAVCSDISGVMAPDYSCATQEEAREFAADLLRQMPDLSVTVARYVLATGDAK